MARPIGSVKGNGISSGGGPMNRPRPIYEITCPYCGAVRSSELETVRCEGCNKVYQVEWPGRLSDRDTGGKCQAG